MNKEKNANRPCVVMTHSFDPETRVFEYSSYEQASKELVRMYREYIEEERRNNSILMGYVDDNYGQVVWNGGDKTYFTIACIETTTPARKRYRITRENNYGTQTIRAFTATSWENALKIANLEVLATLEEAFENDPESDWEEVCLRKQDQHQPDDYFAHGIDPEYVDGYIDSESYLSLADISCESTSTPSEISADEEILLEIADKAIDDDLLEPYLKLTFLMRKAGCTMSEIKEAIFGRDDFVDTAIDLLFNDDRFTEDSYCSIILDVLKGIWTAQKR